MPHRRPSQWQGRKNSWDKEWNFGPGRSGPTTAVLKDLSMLPLWYDGVTGLINIPLGTVDSDLKYIPHRVRYLILNIC